MSTYIDADKLLANICAECEYVDTDECKNGHCSEREWINNALVEDVTPIVRAEWIYADDEEKKFVFQIVCSHCHESNRYPTFNENDEVIQWTYERTRYCPNCGAIMRSNLKPKENDNEV